MRRHLLLKLWGKNWRMTCNLRGAFFGGPYPCGLEVIRKIAILWLLWVVIKLVCYELLIVPKSWIGHWCFGFHCMKNLWRTFCIWYLLHLFWSVLNRKDRILNNLGRNGFLSLKGLLLLQLYVLLAHSVRLGCETFLFLPLSYCSLLAFAFRF